MIVSTDRNLTLISKVVPKKISTANKASLAAMIMLKVVVESENSLRFFADQIGSLYFRRHISIA